MHWADINAAIYRVEWSPTKIGRALDVAPNAVSAVIRGKIASRKIATFISSITSIPLSRLWPGRYDESSTPSRRDTA